MPLFSSTPKNIFGITYVESTEICKQPIAKSSNLTASSEYGKKDATHMYGAERGYLDTKEEVINGVTEIGGWAAATNDQNQFIQATFSRPHLIRDIITQGRHGCCSQWVTSYSLQYSYDCKQWKTVGGVNATIFKGNADEDSKVTNKLSCPIWARCVRVVPKTWNSHIAMRLEFLGCPIKMPGAPTSPSSTAVNSSPPSTTLPVTTVHLPTGVASNYNPLDPVDCKRSLLAYNCSIPLIRQHCKHSCGNSSTNASTAITVSATTVNQNSASTVSASNATQLTATTSGANNATSPLATTSQQGNSQTSATQSSSSGSTNATQSIRLPSTPPPCDEYLVSGTNPVPDSHITASSEYGTHDPKHDYSAARARINNTETKNPQGVTQMGAWTADILDKNQYIRVELNQQSTIKAIVTKGRDGCCKQWVTKYVMMYSTDGKHWQEYGSNPAHHYRLYNINSTTNRLIFSNNTNITNNRIYNSNLTDWINDNNTNHRILKNN
uniref:Inactive carboxypeptidase-like protein X2 n=1 Tax=Magallana gigas TaxID=29159 RepID=K1QGX0_MAGGI